MQPVLGPPQVLALSGDVTIFEVASFLDALVTLVTLRTNGDPVELDLSGVERMDTAGIQLVLAACRSGRITVRGMTPCVREAVMRLGCPELASVHEE